MIYDETDEVIKELFHSLKNRYQNNLELIKSSEFAFMFSYCITNAIKSIPIVVDHI